VLRLRRYERISVQNRHFALTGAGWPKISGKRGPTIHSSSQKTRLWYKNLDRFFFSFVTMHAFDWQTDGRTPFSSLVRALALHAAQKNIFEQHYRTSSGLSAKSELVSIAYNERTKTKHGVIRCLPTWQRHNASMQWVRGIMKDCS